MVATSLLVLTLALPPSGGESHWQLAVGGAFTYRAFSDGPGIGMPLTVDGSTLQGSGTAAVGYFTRALVDDDAAPSLQPFLQRATELSLDGYGYGFHLTAWPLGPHGRDGDGGAVHASATSYPVPWMRWHLSFGVQYDRFHDGAAPAQSQLALPIELSLGARRHDLLGYVGWDVTPRQVGQGAFDVPFWGGVYVGGEAVLARRIDLHGSVQVLDRGAEARGGVSVWLARRFGVAANVAGGHGAVGPGDPIEDYAGAGAGVTWWFIPRLAATLSYSGQWYRYSSDSVTNGASHVLSLALTARPG